MSSPAPENSALSTQHSALKSMRLGLLGGSFNPIHNCHLQIAALVRDRMRLDRVLFIPAGDPPHKPERSLAPAIHRYEMVRLAIEADRTFAVSDIEIQRTGKSYSIETIRALRNQRAQDDELFFIIGLDAFIELPSWKEAAHLLQSCHFVVVSRPGLSFRLLATMPLFPPVSEASLAALDSRSQDRVDMPITPTTVVTLLYLPPCEVSASDIRSRLYRRESLAKVLPPPVESYILTHGLYREDAHHTGV